MINVIWQCEIILKLSQNFNVTNVKEVTSVFDNITFDELDLDNFSDVDVEPFWNDFFDNNIRQ